MAKNISVEFLQDPMTHFQLPVTNPTTVVGTPVPASGAPVLWNGVPAVAETNPETGLADSSTYDTPTVTSCVAEFIVKGIGVSGQNSAVNAGDVVYYQTSTDTLDKNANAPGAVPFGIAFGNSLNNSNNLGTDTRTGQLVASGNTTTYIRVWVGKFPQSQVGPKTLQFARALYSFAVDGGGVGNITPSISDWIPANAIVVGTPGFINSSTAVTSAGSATVAVGTTAGSSTTSILGATAKASLSLDAVLESAAVAAPFKMTAAGQIQITVGTAALTAGVIEIVVPYLVPTNA